MTEPPKPTIRPKRSAWQIVGILLIVLLVLSLITGVVGVSAYNDANPVVERQPYEYGGNRSPKLTLHPLTVNNASGPGFFGSNSVDARREVDADTIERVKKCFEEFKTDLPHMKPSSKSPQIRMVLAMLGRGRTLAPADLTYPPSDPDNVFVTMAIGYESRLAATTESLGRQLLVWRTWNWKEMEIGRVNRLDGPMDRRMEDVDYEVFVAFPKPDGGRIKVRFILNQGPQTSLYISAWDNVATGEGSDIDVALSLIAFSTNPGRDRLLLNLRSLPYAHRLMDEQNYVEARKQLDVAARAQPTWPFQAAYDLAEARYDLECPVDSDDGDRLIVDRLDDVLDRNPLNLQALALQMQTHFQQGRYQEIEELARQYQSVTGPDADAMAWAGAAQLKLKQSEEARVLFREALKLDPHQATAIAGLLKLTPADEKRAYVDNLAKLKYFRGLFHRLQDDQSWHNDWKTLELLARAHGRRFPEDGTAASRLVQALMMQDQFAAATKAFRSELPKLAGGPREELVALFLNTSRAKHRQREAYDELPNGDRPRAFQQTMQDWNSTLAYSDLPADAEFLQATAAKFRSLLAAHEKTHPDDASVSIYRANQQNRDDDPTGAEKTSRAVLDRVKPTGDQNKDYASGFTDARREWLLAKVQLGQSLAARDRFPDETTFDELAQACIAKTNISELAKLLAGRDEAGAKPAHFHYWSGELHWMKKEYEPSATQMKLYSDQLPESGPGRYYINRARDRLIRSWVKSKNSEAALEYLGEQEEPQAVLKALALAASQNTEEAEAFLLAEMARSAWHVNQAYSDPDLGPLLKEPAFDRLRQKYPPPVEPKKKSK